MVLEEVPSEHLVADNDPRLFVELGSYIVCCGWSLGGEFELEWLLDFKRYFRAKTGQMML